MKEKFKKLKPYVIGMTIGLFLVSSGVIADTIIDSPNVSYENTSVKNALDELYELADLKDEIEELKQTIDNQWEKIYPVGSIYTSVSSTSPATLFGGTWVSVGKGRVLQNADDNHSAGTTIEAGLPNITGDINVSGAYGEPASDNTSGFYNGTGALLRSSSAAFLLKNISTTAAWDTKSRGLGFDASKSNVIYGNSTTVQPPAYVVNMWRRTA